MTADEIIKGLQSLYQQLQKSNLTRLDVRKNGQIPERAIKKHFGTFEEAKRQAGIAPTRHTKKLENDIAKHASLENYKRITEEKKGYESKYLNTDKTRFQTILVGSDVHDIECCPFWRKMFLETARRVQPESIVLNGDLFDLPEFGKYGVDPREWDVVGRIKWAHAFLKDLREAAPNSELTLIEGNHEARFLRHLAEAAPSLQAILHDLHGFTVPKLLGLDEFQVNYVAHADLATFTKGDEKKQLSRNFLIKHDFLVFHHFPEARTFGLPGVNGHHHKHEVSTYYSPIHGVYEWHQLGAGHVRRASYTNGEKWSNGFCLIHADIVAKRAQFEYIDTTSDHVVIGGKWYFRE